MKKNLHSQAPPTNSIISSLCVRHAMTVLILVLPFFVLYWLVPFIGKHPIGQDYQLYWNHQQLYLQFSMRNGTFPLYAPGFVGGWTASALTLGQLWHPISWLAAHLPGYWNGHATRIVTLLRLLSLGGVHLVLFMFLKRLRLTTVLAFVISFITVYNLRMLDTFRYGASLENYVAHLLLCVAVAWHYVTPTKRLGPLAIAVCTWLLVVGGHPQFAYFGFLGAAIICLVMPFYMTRLLSDQVSVQRRKIWAYYFSVGLSVTVGFLLALPYILPYYFEYLPETLRSISGTNFRWACGFQDTLGGALSNLFNPFQSDVHGAFGASALILLTVLTPLLFLFRIRVPWPVLYLWLACIITFVLMLGSNGPLYYYFWKYFPLAQSFRVPGRLGLILPFMLLLLLAWIARQEPLRFRIRSHNIHISPLALLATAALVLFAVFNGFFQGLIEFHGAYPRYSPANIHDIPTAVVVLTIAFGLVSLVALALFNTPRRLARAAAIVLVAAVFLQVTATLRYGTWVGQKYKTTLTFEKMCEQQQRQFAYQGPSGFWSRPLIEHLQRTFLEPTLARICRKYTVVASREQAYQRMARQRSIDHVFVENYPVMQANTGVPAPDSMGLDSIQLNYNSFNNLKFDVTCARPAFFVFSFPYSQRWRAYVNGQYAPVYRANGLEHVVWLPAGKSVVEFRYWSWPVLTGVVLSCLTLLLILLYLLTALHSGLLRRLAIIAAVCFCTLTLLTWYRSLYGGGNIGTEYTWNSEDIQPHLSSHHNLAYGGKTAMTQRALWPHSRASSRGVDGQRGPESGFVTSVGEPARWQVDLGRAEPISEIVIYKHDNNGEEYDLPFDVIVSPDGKHSFLVKTITEKGSGNHWRIRLRNITARYIRLQTRTRGRLALAEVEIYGPQDTKLNSHLK